MYICMLDNEVVSRSDQQVSFVLFRDNAIVHPIMQPCSVIINLIMYIHTGNEVFSRLGQQVSCVLFRDNAIVHPIMQPCSVL